jgi:hypothetical protein
VPCGWITGAPATFISRRQFRSITTIRPIHQARSLVEHKPYTLAYAGQHTIRTLDMRTAQLKTATIVNASATMGVARRSLDAQSLGHYVL